jgi:hypothetical protein
LYLFKVSRHYKYQLHAIYLTLASPFIRLIRDRSNSQYQAVLAYTIKTRPKNRPGMPNDVHFLEQLAHYQYQQQSSASVSRDVTI